MTIGELASVIENLVKDGKAKATDSVCFVTYRNNKCSKYWIGGMCVHDGSIHLLESYENPALIDQPLPLE